MYVPITEALDLTGLSLMLAQYAVSTYECPLIASSGQAFVPVSGDTLSIISKNEQIDLTGPTPFGMDDPMEYVASRVHALLARGGRIEIDGVALWIGPLHPLERAYRPTSDVLILRTGGTRPASMLIIAERTRVTG